MFIQKEYGRSKKNKITPHEILTVVIIAIGVIAAVVTGFIGDQNRLRKTAGTAKNARVDKKVTTIPLLKKLI